MSATRIYRRAATLIALLAILAAAASSSAIHRVLLDDLQMVNAVIEQHIVAGIIAFIAFAAISAMLAFVSIAVLVPAAVFAWGAPTTAAFLWIGWIIGGIAAYAIGRAMGRPMVRLLATEQALQRMESMVRADTPFILIVLLQLALPSELPGYMLGLLRYPLTRYALELSLAELPYALATVYLGATFIEGRSGRLLLIGMLITLLSLAAFSAVHRATRHWQSGDVHSSSDVPHVGLKRSGT